MLHFSLRKCDLKFMGLKVCAQNALQKATIQKIFPAETNDSFSCISATTKPFLIEDGFTVCN